MKSRILTAAAFILLVISHAWAGVTSRGNEATESDCLVADGQ